MGILHIVLDVPDDDSTGSWLSFSFLFFFLADRSFGFFGDAFRFFFLLFDLSGLLFCFTHDIVFF